MEEPALIPPPALDPEVMREYVYGNFHWPEVRDWLVPQLAPFKRIVILDGTELGVVRHMLEEPGFPKEKLVGIWDTLGRTGDFHGVPLLANEDAIIRAKPDLLLSTLVPANKRFPAMTAIHLMTRAALFPNLMFANPFAGSMMISKADGEPSNIFDPRMPAYLRESVVRHMARYVFFSGWAAGKDVLDIASGNGYGTHLLSRVARRVVGVDLNEHLIGFAKRRNAAPNIEYVCQDLVTMPRPKEDQRFDLITSVETVEHVPTADLEGFTEALRGFLKPGGTLLCTTPKATETVRNPQNREHIAEYSTEEFVGILSRHFDVKTVVFQKSDSTFHGVLPEGTKTPQSVESDHIVQIAIATPR